MMFKLRTNIERIIELTRENAMLQLRLHDTEEALIELAELSADAENAIVELAEIACEMEVSE